jgi:hypothetical protein
MRIVLSMILCAGIFAAIGCRDNGKTEIKEATPEEIQQQKEAENRVKAEESTRRMTQPETHGQSVSEQERARGR